MSILLQSEIIRLLEEGDALNVTPYNRKFVNPNSYDLHLGGSFQIFRPELLSAREASRGVDPYNPTHSFWENIELEFGDQISLHPGQFMLACTLEATRTRPPYVPLIEGKSSLARLSFAPHVAAGFGDAGFGEGGEGNPPTGKWTLECTTAIPIRLTVGMPIAQIYWVKGVGECQPYKGRYTTQFGATLSRFHKDRQRPTEEDFT